MSVSAFNGQGFAGEGWVSQPAGSLHSSGMCSVDRCVLTNRLGGIHRVDGETPAGWIRLKPVQIRDRDAGLSRFDGQARVAARHSRCPYAELM